MRNNGEVVFLTTSRPSLTFLSGAISRVFKCVEHHNWHISTTFKHNVENRSEKTNFHSCNWRFTTSCLRGPMVTGNKGSFPVPAPSFSSKSRDLCGHFSVSDAFFDGLGVGAMLKLWNWRLLSWSLGCTVHGRWVSRGVGWGRAGVVVQGCGWAGGKCAALNFTHWSYCRTWRAKIVATETCKFIGVYLWNVRQLGVGLHGMPEY